MHPIRASTRIHLDIDMDRLYYTCKDCKRVHSIGHNEIPHFECTEKFDVYHSCTYSKFNRNVKKICTCCCSIQIGLNVGYVSFCPKCKIHVLHFLNGKQIPVFDAHDSEVQDDIVASLDALNYLQSKAFSLL